ncbi:MAG: hypothetical protein AAF657_25300 [Acidobacteriota bacterium]
MSMETDRDWLDLADDWQADDESAPPAPIPADIRRRVQRFSWGLYAWTVFEALSLAAILAFATSLPLKRPELLEITTALTVWLLIGVGMGFTLWNRRGTWRPASQTTRAFVELAHERTVRQLRGIRFAWWLLAVEVALFTPWILWVVHSKPEKQARIPEIYWTSYGLLAGLTSLSAFFLWGYRRHVQRQHVKTRAALEEISTDDAGVGTAV